MKANVSMMSAAVISLVAVLTCAGAAVDVDARIRTLRAALSYGDTEAKLGAIGAVARLGPGAEGSAGLLVEALSDGDAKVRLAAVVALGKIGPSAKGVVGVLIKLVEGKDDAMAREAVNVLRLTGPGAAPGVNALLKYAEGKDINKRKLVIYALGKIGPAANRASPMLIRTLKSGDRNLRESAAYALGNIGQPVESVVGALIGALGDRDNVVRERGALGLGKIGPPASKAQSALRKALKDADRTVAARAAWALGRLKASDEQTIAMLIESLQSTDLNALATAALGRAGKPGIDALVKMLGRDPVRRLLAVRALGRIGPPAAAAAPVVKKAIADKDANVRRAAVLALKKIVETPKKCVNVLTVSGAHTLVCKSSWHNINGSWAMKGKMNISGIEALAMIDPKSRPGAGQYALPKKLAVSLGERLFKTAQFTDAQKQELAKWLGTGKRNEKSSSKVTMTTVSKTNVTPDGMTLVEVSLKGLLKKDQSHRLASRSGPNCHEAKWSIDILGQLTVDSISGRIIKANITATGQSTGRYYTSGSSISEPYTESFKLVLVAKAPPRVK